MAALGELGTAIDGPVVDWSTCADDAPQFALFQNPDTTIELSIIGVTCKASKVVCSCNKKRKRRQRCSGR